MCLALHHYTAILLNLHIHAYLSKPMEIPYKNLITIHPFNFKQFVFSLAFL